MSKVTAIKNSMNRATRLRKGNGISRTYHNVKFMSRFETAVSASNLLLALQAVRNRWTFNTVVITGLTLYFSKKAVDFHNLSADIYPYYQSIVDRAKQIYKR